MKDEAKACVIREVSRILEEEPRLEAVALSENQRKLSIGILGRTRTNGLRAVFRRLWQRASQIADT